MQCRSSTELWWGACREGRTSACLQVQSRNVLFEMYCLMWAQPCTYTHQPCWPCFCIQAQGTRFLLLNTAAIKLRKCFAGETHLAAMKQCWSTTHTLLPTMCNMCYLFLVSTNAMAGSGLNSTRLVHHFDMIQSFNLGHFVNSYNQPAMASSGQFKTPSA